MRFDSIIEWSRHYLPKLERRLVRVEGGDCKIWTGGPTQATYGQMKVYFPTLGTIGGPWEQQNIRVHRLSYMLQVPTFNIQDQALIYPMPVTSQSAVCLRT